MKEIGGYFGLEHFAGKEYYEDLIAVNNGRNALAYLIKIRGIKKLFLPAFLCDSVAGVCNREGCSVAYYPVGKDFLPVFDEDLKADEWIYIVNFYGQITNAKASSMKDQWRNVIFDNVQAFFQKPVKSMDTVYSCRKFFGVPDGGYVACDTLSDKVAEQDVSMDRMKHVLGRFEGVASDYYAEFKANDHSFVELPLRGMSKLTHNLLRAIDYELVRKKRNENYAALERALGDRNQLQLNMPDGPYCYPFYCENGMAVKKQLAEKKIYIPTLWPNVLNLEGFSLEKDYAANILPLPCDQRYGVEDMDRIAREILANI
ncbi:MAG: hypothetical protein J6Q92_03435 [Oscillospiraceae bacterium]|nr:hypothetical protein [Oscillospiraceae bacterium]